MKILLAPHQYLPHKIAGCEVYLHRLAKYLQSKGHTIKVLILYKDPYTIDGIDVLKVEHDKDWQNANNEIFQWADIVFTQLWGVPFAVNKCRQHDKKMIYIAHNTNQSTSFQHLGRNGYVLYNSRHLHDFLKFPQQSFILPPPIDYRLFQKSKGRYITLVNHCEAKGGSILIEIAKRLPQYQFLAIQGGYGEQIKSDLPNITYEQPQDIEGVLARTRLLLMPSLIETYGQIAIEAYACGIPVIASITDGLREALGYNGIFIDRNNIEAYVDKIVSLLNNKREYAKASQYALERAKELDPAQNLEEFHNWLISL